MWSHIGLCFLVGFAFASKNPGWKEDTEYVYKVRGRTLASLHEISNQYSGIFLKADLVIQPKQDGKLNVMISKPEYAQVHSELSGGWNTEIPDSELSYKHLGMSHHPFQIDMKDGVIRDLIVDKSVPNWEANIIKSIMSQFQLNTYGKNSFGDGSTESSEEGDNKVFKTMEETITGYTETSYDIHPLPEHRLQGDQWKLSHLLQMKGDGDIIEVVKHKNYTNNKELPSYHYGFAGLEDGKPATNQMGNFFIRDSMSRAILTGNMNHHTVHNSYTVNEIIMSPTLNDKQKGSVVSMLNVTLEKMQSKSEQIEDVSNPVRLGGLVYTYDRPFSKPDGPRVRKSEHRRHGDSDESSSEEGGRYRRSMDNMLRRSAHEEFGYKSDESGESSESSESGEYYKQDKPKLEDVLESPLLPYTTGYKGKSIKHDVDIKQSVKKIAKDIGNDLQHPEDSLRKNALNKFTIMTSLIRIMDEEELQQVSSDLYSESSSKGPERDAWTSYRDAVAESGTGPAFLTIKDWIQSKKIKESEAAHIVATMTKAVRAPTVEYAQSYFDFIMKPEVRSQEHLNETALMAFTNFLRKVYVDNKKSKNQYPVKSFGSFRTSEGRKLVEDKVIPYLAEQLQDAISRADTKKIHANIRALGNVGHPKILAAFEPYLEGEKQASQFQRLLMVVAMDKLCETNPKIARDVLYNIYQNAGETQEVRTAAVHQLMRTMPPTSMLQRMADYTNIDTQEHVNAAVKSSIESAANLEGEEFHHLRSNAEAAMPLLTKKEYGVQHGSNYLRSYAIDELQLMFKHSMQSMGNDEDYYPKGLKYSVRANMGGLKHRMANIQAMVSSIQELEHVGKLQTASYQQEMEMQRQQADKQQQEKYSSQKIAKLLNMEGDEHEQLEGYMYMELHDYVYEMISFDNHSLERLPEEIRKYEEEMKNGKDYHYTKLSNEGEMAISFPTEMGLPFLFTYDTPALYKVEGSLKGVASPQISQGDKLYKPDTVKMNSKVEATVNWKIQSRLSFSTPFDHHQYISGYDKNIQMHVPLHGQVEVDIKNGQVKAELSPEDWHQGAQNLHYSTWPYTSTTDIKNFQPISLQPNTHHIKQTNMRSYDRVYGKRETGMAWHVQINHERESLSLSKLYNLVQMHGVMGALMSLGDEASIQHSEMSIRYLHDESSLHKCVVRLGYQRKYKPQSGGDDAMDSDFWKKLSHISDPLGRQEELMKKLSVGINSADVKVGDMSVEFKGDSNIKYTATGGYAKSNVDPKSHVMMYGKKSSDSQEVKPYEMSLMAKSDIPNTNGLDLGYSMMKEPKADTEYKVRFGQTHDTEIEGEIRFRRSEERKEYLKELPMYYECEREMREGNYQLPACANLTMSSNLLDEVSMNIKHENMNPDVVEQIKAIYNAFKVDYYPTLEYNKDHGNGKENEIDLHANFDPDLRFVNVSVESKDEESTVNNIEVGEMGKTVFVVHPVFHVYSRIMRDIHGGLQTYRPICVVDKTAMSTFNNRTYPASMDEHWTVVFHYVPKEGRHQREPKSVEEQLRHQTEHYVVLARKSPDSREGKDIKITVSSPETDYKLMDITMQPQPGSGGKKVKVQVNGQEVQVSDKKSHDIGDGYVQIYGLPNGEVKMEIRDNFYAIYDGRRMKLTVLDGKFRNSVRGLCGAFNDDKTEDFLTPGNCIVRDHQQLIKSYDIGSSEMKQLKSHECVPKEVPLYVNVIPREEVSRSSYSGDCNKHQTRYVEKGGEICFTIHEMPVCGGHCRPHGLDMKSVSVHCMKKSNAAQLWKSQIDRGHSPDFSHKKETKIIAMKVPRSCSH